jgi:TPR repeat protein
MGKILATLLIGLTLTVSGGIVHAGPYEDATAAYQRGDFATALRLVRPLAEQGFAKAQFNLGFMYDNGQGTAQDYREAIKWYRLAAEQGFAQARFNLGFMYDQGQGVAQDYLEALKWYRLAAEQGLAGAQFNLGVRYAKGQGVAQDYIRAHMWFNLAASNARGESGQRATKNRDIVAENLTPGEVAHAQEMARECEARRFKNCE